MDGLYDEVRPDLLSLQGKTPRKNKTITKQFILDQLSDNEVDLSMSDLTTVPVKELVHFLSSIIIIKCDLLCSLV